MTFSSKTKDELSRTEITDMLSARAEVAAVARTMGYVTLKGLNKIEIEFSTENAAVARRVFKLLKTAFDISTEVSIEKTNRLKKHNNYIVKINDSRSKGFLQEIKIAGKDSVNFMTYDFGVPRELIKNDACKRAYVKGAFMGCGSISDPEKSYHAEFVNSREEHSKGICKLLEGFGITGRIILRKNYYVTYVKESEQISDLLALMGASNSVLEFENVRAVKETRNQINRVINCETANLDKIVDTSVRQINSIKVLKKYKAIDTLPDHLRELAYLRLNHSNASLKELGEMLNPPLGKSGVNHRLRKIEEIAKEIEQERGVDNEITKSNSKE